MTYRITGLDPAPFLPLYGLPEAELSARGILRVVAEDSPGYPDRIELRDAEVGENLLLLNHEHLPVAGPYRAAHAIYVIEGATQRTEVHDRVPEVLHRRILSLRAYDETGMMLDGDLAEGHGIDPALRRMLSNPAVAYIHAHNAKRGCYAARIDRD